MAKKKSSPKKTGRPVEREKVALQVRLDRDVHEQLVRIVEQAGISLNQLIAGGLRWIAKNAVNGEPIRDSVGRVIGKDQPGCVFFGKVAKALSQDELIDLHERFAMGDFEDGIPKNIDLGSIVFMLDFTERSVVREDFQ